MFNFLLDDRKAERYESDSLIIDTCQVSDGERPYETAVSHKEYNGGGWVIVEAYDTEHDALIGHRRWVDKMTSDELPPSLIDCANVSQMCDEMEFPRQDSA